MSNLQLDEEGEHSPLAALSATRYSPSRVCTGFHRCIFEQRGPSFAGRDASSGSWIYPCENRRSAVAVHRRRNGCFISGGHLRLLVWTTIGACRLGKKFHWLHLGPKTLRWPERYFERHGAKAVFIARFIAIFPPVAANLLAGMTKMRWRTFLLYDLTGSAAFTTCYILIGFLFGKQWESLEAWLGHTTLYLILGALAILGPAVIFRHSLAAAFSRYFPTIGHWISSSEHTEDRAP